MTEKAEQYRVLARKYRPSHFDELVGQDALVRTLKNAIESGRIAQAYMLTGIRGTGKTTTARIIAKALNYTGPDGKAGPTTGPTGDCEICRAITEDRHPDVLEMDAASRTGVDDIRELIDGVRYAPTSARYKVYIIDEVHMLSKNAFNALLKTLEEPPAHVIFIFATTEIRKVPITVLSRCQRFDLRRVDTSTLAAHYAAICEKEGVAADDAALAMIARAADGSVRDGLSLLDQAISLSAGKIDAPLIQDMLGLVDRAQMLDILEHALKGACAEALAISEDLYKKGADPAVLVQDMLDFTHLLTRLRAVPDLGADAAAIDEGAREKARSLSAALSMPTLGRAWQILLKGMGEVQMAPNPHAAAEMLIIRLAYAADLPDPSDLLKKLKDQPQGGQERAASSPQAPVREQLTPEPVAVSAGGGAQAQAAPAPLEEQKAYTAADVKTLQDLEQALKAAGEVILAGQVYQYVHLVKLEPGRLEIRPHEDAPSDLSSRLGKALTAMTGERWVVSISGTPGSATLAEQKSLEEKALLDKVCAHPLVSEIIELFPGAEVKVRHGKTESSH